MPVRNTFNQHTMDISYYRGIKIEDVFGLYEFFGHYEQEIIMGNTDTEENAQAIIDETINYIKESQERDLFETDSDFYFPEIIGRKFSNNNF